MRTTTLTICRECADRFVPGGTITLNADGTGCEHRPPAPVPAPVLLGARPDVPRADTPEAVAALLTRPGMTVTPEDVAPLFAPAKVCAIPPIAPAPDPLATARVEGAWLMRIAAVAKVKECDGLATSDVVQELCALDAEAIARGMR